MRGGDQAGVVRFGHAAALALAAAVDPDPVEVPARLRPEADHACCDTAGAFPGHYGHGMRPQAGPGAGFWWPQGSHLVLEAEKGAPRSPPLASKLDPGHVPPGRDRGLVAFGGAVYRDLRGEPDPVQQIRRAAQRVPDVEQPPDQGGHPLQRPPLILTPAVRRPGPYPAQRAAGPAAPPTAGMLPRPAPLGCQRQPGAARPASAAATGTPTSCSPAAHALPAPASCRARTAAAACLPHPLTPRPPSSGQATTIGISHRSWPKNRGCAGGHAGTPTVIRQTPDP